MSDFVVKKAFFLYFVSSLTSTTQTVSIHCCIKPISKDFNLNAVILTYVNYSKYQNSNDQTGRKIRYTSYSIFDN